jgi:hypothetical protein
MREKTVKWCCDSFRERYDSAGKRTIAVLVDRFADGTPHFIIQSRAFERGTEQPLHLSVPVSLVNEDTMNFCPWCGVPLRRWYREWIDELTRTGFKISRG